MARSHEGTFVLVDIRGSRFVIANGFVHVSSPYPSFGPGKELLTYRGGLCVRAYDRGANGWLDSWGNPGRPIQQKIHLRPMYGGTLCGPILRDLRNQRDMDNRVRCISRPRLGDKGSTNGCAKSRLLRPKIFWHNYGRKLSHRDDRNDNRTYRLWPSLRSVWKLSTCFYDNGTLLAQWESVFLVRKTACKKSSLMTTSCKLRYLARGLETNQESRQSLSEELSTVSGVACVTILPVVKGWSIEVDFSDISPFGKSSFETYFAEQILKEAIMLRCNIDGALQLELLLSSYEESTS